MKKALIIFNSQNRTNYFTENLPRIIHHICSKGYIVEAYSTQASKDCISKVSTSQVDLIVAAGGDGTIYEVVNGLQSVSKKPKILYFPTGTVNDFAFSLNIPNSVDGVLRLLDSESYISVDIGLLDNGTVFNYVASFGSFTKTSHTTSHVMKQIFGPLAYVMEGIREIPDLWSKKAIRITLDHDEVIEGRYGMAIISNSKSVGGIRHMFKQNELNDGKFNLLLIENMEKVVSVSTTFLTGVTNDTLSKNIKTYSFEHIKVETEDDIKWTIDGESGPVGSLEVSILKNNVQIYSGAINEKK